MTADFFKRGDRVILKADLKKGWAEERGEIINIVRVSGAYLVRVDPEHRYNDDDFGLREVTADQLEPERAPAGARP